MATIGLDQCLLGIVGQQFALVARHSALAAAVGLFLA
jgi:hypothetical protein